MKKRYSFSLIGLLIAGLTACDDYLDINDDPYLPQVAEPHLYLPQIAYAMAEGEMFDSRYVGEYSQYWSYVNPYYNYDMHGSRGTADNPSAAAQRWRNHYWSIGSNVNEVMKAAEERGYGAYEGIGKAIMAWSWLQATDTYGPMPYQQAWDNTQTKFTYDTQEYIYGEIDKLADEALVALEAADATEDVNLPEWELIYNGDLSKWRKMVYAVKARRANHLSNKALYNPDQVIQYVDNAFESNDDNLNIYFEGNSSATANFLGASRANYNNYRQGRVVIELLDGTQFNGVEDPRLPLMFNANPDSDYHGVSFPLGDTLAGQMTVTPGGDTVANAIPRMYGKYLFLDGAPYPLMTYFELQFIKAEAAFHKGDLGTALAAFQEGVRSHMDYVGVDAGAAADYLASDALPQASTDLTLAHIMSQKYIALFTNNETWADLRRYDYSGDVFMGFALPDTLRPENMGKPVERCLPTQYSEYDWNQENIAAEGGLENDYHTKPLWFTEP
ncbi:Starch-binding associating with outer membrane [Catalinimonas alkaloidigena]|uniref:Starch-binding associating with outer membrane n=1 Tax=Catalinimonas alkaloidigena TaxID=1075417 RepID=A0A1G9GB55_9BACT|nr:SusD/RagB family nutrient-binding outer membrane lipoprotein [Catalinimonas alkaloidigena]SDK97805.1 Starch-binding associating with outer membrane [Catalinimonas alkaloidigena]